VRFDPHTTINSPYLKLMWDFQQKEQLSLPAWKYELVTCGTRCNFKGIKG